MNKMKHPEHHCLVGPSYRIPAKPLRGSFLTQLIAEYRCYLNGGHWWHAEWMIDWFCCQCGAETDGMPNNGDWERSILWLPLLKWRILR